MGTASFVGNDRLPIAKKDVVGLGATRNGCRSNMQWLEAWSFGTQLLVKVTCSIPILIRAYSEAASM